MQGYGLTFLLTGAPGTGYDICMRIINPVAKYLSLSSNPSGPKGRKLSITREPVLAPAHERGFRFKEDAKLDTSQIDDQRDKTTRTKTIRGRRFRGKIRPDEAMKRRTERYERVLPRKGPKAAGRARSSNTG